MSLFHWLNQRKILGVRPLLVYLWKTRDYWNLQGAQINTNFWGKSILNIACIKLRTNHNKSPSLPAAQSSNSSYKPKASEWGCHLASGPTSSYYIETKYEHFLSSSKAMVSSRILGNAMGDGVAFFVCCLKQWLKVPYFSLYPYSIGTWLFRLYLNYKGICFIFDITLLPPAIEYILFLLLFFFSVPWNR